MKLCPNQRSRLRAFSSLKTQAGRRRRSYSRSMNILNRLIPRGGKKLIETSRQRSWYLCLRPVPAIAIYISTRIFGMACQIAINAKTQRPSVCNAIESILIEENWFCYGYSFLQELHEHGVTIYGDDEVCKTFKTAQCAAKKTGARNTLDLR